MGTSAGQPPRPVFGVRNFVAPGALVCGEVTLGDDCSIWPGVVIRGDIAAIRIGHRVNVQDGTVIHTKHQVPLDIEDDVGIGHRAVVHCRRVGRGSLIGIGAVVLDDCVIGTRCLVAAGAVVTPRTQVPDGTLVAGVPAKVVRELTAAEHDYLDHVVQNYLRLAELHRRGDYPACVPEQD